MKSKEEFQMRKLCYKIWAVDIKVHQTLLTHSFNKQVLIDLLFIC